MQALLLEQQSGKTLASVQTLDEGHLPEGDVTIDVHWSNLSCKNALVITGRRKVIRNSPMIPGIDFAGTVCTSEDPRFRAGQEVLLTGWDIDENHWDGLAEQARVGGDWLVAIPQGLGAHKTVIVGTAGFTTILCVMALEDAGVRPQDGEVVVMGASGGAGSAAVALLHKLGYQVVAVSGRESTYEYPKSLDASRILPRDELAESRPLKRQIWTGAIDTVGDKVLVRVLTQMNYGGCVATCDLAGGFTLPATVMPSILRNVRLQRVDSVMTPPTRRARAWQRLVAGLPESFYTQAAREIPLAEAPKFAEAIINNQIQGRTLVKAN